MVMRLSEAIRLGAALKPQAFGEIFDGVGTCARGAALDASGYQFSGDMIEDCNAWFKTEFATWSTNVPAACPACNYSGNLSGVLTYHLNDRHQWTREQIADFVELHEPLPVPAEVGAEKAEAQ